MNSYSMIKYNTYFKNNKDNYSSDNNYFEIKQCGIFIFSNIMTKYNILISWSVFVQLIRKPLPI